VTLCVCVFGGGGGGAGSKEGPGDAPVFKQTDTHK